MQTTHMLEFTTHTVSVDYKKEETSTGDKTEEPFHCSQLRASYALEICCTKSDTVRRAGSQIRIS